MNTLGLIDGWQILAMLIGLAMICVVAVCLCKAVECLSQDEMDTALDRANREVQRRPRLKPTKTPKVDELPQLPGSTVVDHRDIQHT